MSFAADFRRMAREALRGRWVMAILVGLVAVLLGGAANMGPEVKVNINTSSSSASFNFAGQTVFSTGGTANSQVNAILVGGFAYIVIIALLMGILYFVLGSMIGVGYAKFNLNLTDGTDAEFKDLFSYVSYWKTTSAARFLQAVFILLWSLLLIIPGIAASYSYAMTEYILAENPEMTASEAIARSKDMMYGNRWRLFCLQFSFIGWSLLSTLTLGIGNLWLTPYRQAATAAFYREISGTEYIS